MLDRVVEDMILSSMATGEFSNLKGAGKPLEVDHSNPYLDQTQQKINRILRDSGFAPPWIVKENELKKVCIVLLALPIPPFFRNWQNTDSDYVMSLL